jgi:hypothetical protein
MTGGKWEEGNSLRPQYSQSKFECRQLACQVCERLHSIIHFSFPSRVYQNFDEQHINLFCCFWHAFPSSLFTHLRVRRFYSLA